ncbi:hypothetical protein [Arthrobacter sp. Soil763]|uniref:hypothetical protein n=1 Tax=Arthrobacter sp. Soil763 TaxID=1736402 RepID=UPI0006FCFB2E|nr:hypothetical protein [Arthrobacter sp. Soil763]KRE78731.1 hypothetical protein ASG71_12895 [Arthrobacter sp. Soil763]
MAVTSAVVRPGVEAWQALSRRTRGRRDGMFAWLIGVLTTAGAFITDRGWETLDDPGWSGAYRIIDMFGLASILLALSFSVVGSLLRTHALVAAPLVLLAAAVPHSMDGYRSGAVWWLGAAAAALWAVIAAVRAWHRLCAVQRLAQASSTGRTTTVGPNAVRARKRALWPGLLMLLLFLATACGGWALAFGTLPAELGRTYEELGEESSSNMFAAAAMAASIMTVAAAVQQGWRLFAMGRVGRRLVWEIPAAGHPAQWWLYGNNDAGEVSMEAAEAPGCDCLAEFRLVVPDGEDELAAGAGVPASDYCLLHGIDRINAMTTAEFTALSGETWLWDMASDLPEPADPEAIRFRLYGFCGHTFGGIPVREDRGGVDAVFPGVPPAHEASVAEAGPGWDKPRRPEAGVQDTIDLRPAGYAGFAFRYRHGRAWFETAPSTATG